VSGTNNGEDAVAHLIGEGADLVLLDVSLPGMSGFDVLKQIRDQVRDTAIIITTAFGSEKVVIDALRLGADDFLRKPFEPSEFSSVLNRTVSRLLIRRQSTAKRRQLETELSHAASVQADLLPRETPVIAGFELAAECVPAREVGGDFYDWNQPAPHMASLWLCDVMGKGMAAALLMATVRAVMRAVVRDSAPAAALRYVSWALDADFARTDRFVTLFLAQLDTRTRRLRYLDAGHGHAFVRRACGRVDLLRPRGLPLGVMPNTNYQEGELTMEPGDALVLYSDGLMDARPDLALDPPAIARHLDGAGSALAMIDRLVALLGPVGVPPDDMTLVVLRCNDA
jgi:sigma-B regulation protein RsbU (phosphoserine phosphatase)